MPDDVAASAAQIGAGKAFFPDTFDSLNHVVARRRGGERECKSNRAIHDNRVMQ